LDNGINSPPGGFRLVTQDKGWLFFINQRVSLLDPFGMVLVCKAVVENKILEAIEASDGAGAEKLLAENVRRGMDPWQIHLSLFPVAQRVLNPPFINPHLPKMYAINRELVLNLEKDRIASLVALEIREYALRAKMEEIPRVHPSGSTVSFTEIESAIREKDAAKAATLMSAFCTAFILLEMLQRRDRHSQSP